MNSQATQNERGGDDNARHRDMLAFIVVFASMMLYGSVHDAVPGINEPHYLTKAKFYWDSEWGGDDFFLESSNPHLVFYQTIGLLTQFLSLEQTAWVGRTIGYALVAFGWTTLCRRLNQDAQTAVWSVWGFLTLATIGNFSGEWIVGGIESKVICYGLALTGLSVLLSEKPRCAAALFGAAISFHPVVGIWFAAATIMALIVWYVLARKRGSADDSIPVRNPQLRETAICIAIATMCSLPGLLPALSLLRGGTPQVEYEANYIQVFYRLRHHLDPTDFAVSSYVMYAILAVVWSVLQLRQLIDARRRIFFWFIVAAAVIAIGGWIVGFHLGKPSEMVLFKTRMKLMKFYPFRLFDVVMPLALCVSVAGVLNDWIKDKLQRRTLVVGFSLFAFASSILFLVAREPSADTKRRRNSDWIAACRWIEEHMAQDAVFLTPKSNKNFKWYAQRAEFVSFKDCPQDAAGIVEWNKRLNDIQKWAQSTYDEGYSKDAVQELSDATGITHIITGKKFGPFKFEPIFRNDTYRVYQIR